MNIEQKKLILEDIAAGNFIITHHAYLRMQERSITHDDIVECAKTAREVKAQDDGKFKIHGFDLTDDEITIVCALKNDVIIITVF